MRVLAVLALVSALAACDACAAVPRSVESDRPEDVTGAVVLIMIRCANGTGYGSGLALSPTAVLTAGHVAKPEGCVEPKWFVSEPGGAEIAAVPEVEAAKADAGILRAESDLASYAPAVIGRAPRIGEEACWGPAWPRRGWHCGLVQPDQDDGLITLDYPVEPGNSGSALFDSAGDLVGIVVEFDLARATGQIDGGRATDVTGTLRWIASVR